VNSTIRKALEFLCLPKSWRTRLEPKPEQNDAVMARLPDENPVFRAMMDRAFEQLEQDLMGTTRPGLSAEDRAYTAGRAAAMAQYLTGIEGWRGEARKAAIEELNRSQQRKKEG